MAILDATTLLLLIEPTAKAPIDPNTKKPVERCKERLQFLLQTLSEASVRVVVPTPVLSEVLVGAGSAKNQYLDEMVDAYAFHLLPFDVKAAVELAFLLEAGGKPIKSKLNKQETWAKLKFDRQVVAIALSNKIQEIYTDDESLSDVAAANKMTVRHTWELPLPPQKQQHDLPLGEPKPKEESDDDGE